MSLLFTNGNPKPFMNQILRNRVVKVTKKPQIMRNHCLTVKKVREEPPPTRQSRKVTVERKSPPAATTSGASVEMTGAEELVELWNQEFERAFEVPDESFTEYMKLDLMSDILDDVGDKEKVRRMIQVFLTSERLAWVDNKTLKWLSSARNRTHLASALLAQKKLTKKKKRIADFRGERTNELTFTFRDK